MVKILGNSSPVQDMLKLIERVAKTKTNVLIIGESGTGKELVARMIHDAGVLKGKPFIPVNCGAIPENLIESELFGHKKGSFTGAVGDRQGLFGAASDGSIFLDEVGELPLSMQVKLLRVLQEKTYRPVGGNESLKTDARVIAATNRNLEEAVKDGSFREDLYYRLNVIMIETPPLRDRGEDVLLLADAFLKKFCDKQNKKLNGFSSEARDLLQAYHWPGNVRELENLIERAVALESNHEVNVGAMTQISEAVGRSQRNQTTTSTSEDTGLREIQVPSPDFRQGPIDLDSILGKVEKAYLEEALKFAGTKKTAADLLGITFRSIRYRLKKLGVDSSDSD